MRPVGGTLGVVAEQRISGNVVELREPFLFQRLEALPQRGVIFRVELLLLGPDPRVGEAAIFHQYDRRIGPCLAQQRDQGGTLTADVRRAHIRRAVNYVGRGVNLAKQLAHGGVHPPIAGKAQVDHRTVKTASQDGRMHHARSRGAGTVRNRSPVEHDRFGLARRQSCETRAWRHADLQRFDAVVQRQIRGVLAQAGSQAGLDHLLHFLLVGSGDVHPPPHALLIRAYKSNPLTPVAGMCGIASRSLRRT